VQCTIYNSNASIRLEIHNIVKKVKQIQSLEVYELPNFELLALSQQFHMNIHGVCIGICTKKAARFRGGFSIAY